MTRTDTLATELRIALGYVPSGVREALAVLFELDARLGGIVARAREPHIALIRLVWWRDALDALDDAPPPGEPLLVAAAGLRSVGIAGRELAALAEGWEPLLDDADFGADSTALHARERGGRIFTLAGRLLGGANGQLADAGEGWALIDLARHFAPQTRAEALIGQARAPLQRAMARRWPVPLRPLGMLAALAAQDVRDGAGGLRPAGSRSRLLRLMAHRWTGR